MAADDGVASSFSDAPKLGWQCLQRKGVNSSYFPANLLLLLVDNYRRSSTVRDRHVRVVVQRASRFTAE